MVQPCLNLSPVFLYLTISKTSLSTFTLINISGMSSVRNILLSINENGEVVGLSCLRILYTEFVYFESATHSSHRFHFGFLRSWTVSSQSACKNKRYFQHVPLSGSSSLQSPQYLFIYYLRNDNLKLAIVPIESGLCWHTQHLGYTKCFLFKLCHLPVEIFSSANKLKTAFRFRLMTETVVSYELFAPIHFDNHSGHSFDFNRWFAPVFKAIGDNITNLELGRMVLFKPFTISMFFFALSNHSFVFRLFTALLTDVDCISVSSGFHVNTPVIRFCFWHGPCRRMQGHPDSRW
nr:MAG TPA: hypothetical protein [Caudoviricetes sp.]